MTAASHTTSRDRKVLKSIDADASRNSMYAIISYLVLFAWISTIGGGYELMPRWTVAIGLMLALITAVRVTMNLHFESFYGSGPARWRRMFYFFTHVHAAIWSLYLVSLILVFGLSLYTFIAWVYTVAVCSATIVSSSAYLYTNRAFISILLLPTITVLVLRMEVNYGLLAAVFLLFYLFISRQASYLFATFWDRVELQRLLRKKLVDLQLAREAGDAADQAKNDFLSIVTHEIRTPMNNVLGMLSLMQDTELTEIQREYLSISSQAGESLLSLIDDILDFSKIVSKSIQLEDKVFDLRGVFQDVVEMLGPTAHQRGIELSYICDPQVPIRVKGDANRLNQVLVNLLNNSIKYGSEGEIILDVNMTFPRVDVGLLRVHVSNRGQGLSQRQQEKIFDAFSRIGGSKQDNLVGGSGLGLAICKGIVECMQGEIGVISDEYSGTTFWFTAHLQLSSQQTKEFQADQRLIGAKILVVDPRIGGGRALLTEMEQWGISAELIDSYDKAVQILRESAREDCEFDVVIMSMDLANNKECLGLSSIMAQDPRLSATKQIILTSLVQRGGSSVLNHSKKVPQALFVTKPVHRKSLYNALSRLFDISQDEEKNERASRNFVKDSSRHFAILLAEDNRVNQMVAKGMIKKLGYEVKVVGNGKEALGIIEDKEFDLVLMDCLMPVMDGYEATQEIRVREQGTEKHIPIIAMTANTYEGEDAKCFAAGMDDFMAKPVNIDELAAKLTRWLGEDISGVEVIDNQKRNGRGDGRVVH